MEKRYAPNSRALTNAAILSALLGVACLAAATYFFVPRLHTPNIVVTPPTPTSLVAQVLPTKRPGDTPVPPTATNVPVVPTATFTPTASAPVSVDAAISTPVPYQAPLLPDVGPGASATVAATATPKAPPATTKDKPTAKPAPTKTPNPNLLPNGVLYGDPRPNLPDRIVRIASPNIKLDTRVYEVYVDKKTNTWQVADYAAGHNYNSANPGEGGNIVLSGHNNWRGEVFRYLEFLKTGDTIQLWTLSGKEYDYRVTDMQKLLDVGVSMAQRLKNAEVMNPTDHEQLTLITCWPYTTYTHRLIITALPVR